MAVGMDLRKAPSKDLTAGIAESAEGICFFAFGEVIGADDETAGLAIRVFLLSSLANVSASHGAFTFPREAGRLLFHSAEPSSPAICAMTRSLSRELSYCSMTHP